MTKIRYLSLFSGIEAFSCAVKDMPEFVPVAFAEIEPFPCAVLAHHYPDVPNLGDVTKIDGRKYRGLVDIIVGGSPCQGFSVAGQRKGLDDERSCLALTYVRLVDEVRPKWLLYENVPGMFSCNGGEDYRQFIAALADIGYSFAWTVLDSQYFGVAQRRRRVFLVGHLGTDWERPAKVLLEPQSLCGDPPPRRKAGEEHPRPSEGGARERGEQDGGVAQNPTFATLCASGAGCDRPSAQGSQLDYCVVDAQPNKTAPSLTSSGAAFARTGQQGSEVDALVLDKPAYAVKTAHTSSNGIGIQKESAHTLDTSAQPEAVAFAQNQRDEVRQMDVAGALAAEPGMKQTTYVMQDVVGALTAGDAKQIPSTIEGKLVAEVQEKEVYPIAYKDADSGGGDGDPAYTLRTDHCGAVAVSLKKKDPSPAPGSRRNASEQPERSKLPGQEQRRLSGSGHAEEIVCDAVSGALCARDYKSVTSTIDGKLIAVRTESE